jgi:hypothetical protein
MRREEVGRRRFLIGATCAAVAPGCARMAMAGAEDEIYADLAAILDPACHVYHIGPSWSVSVPQGETWYALNIWSARRPGSAHKLFHRDADARNPFIMSAGFDLESGCKDALILYARPKLVQDVDPRYRDDPRGFYFARLNQLRTLRIQTLSVERPAGTPSDQSSKAFMPDDFAAGLVTQWQCHNGAWLGLIGPGPNIINTQDEIDDKYPMRITSSVLLPFRREMFNGIWLFNGSHDGNWNQQAAQAWTGWGAAHYVKLPAEW